jgi:putative ATP-grasp target RiPP
MKPFPASTVLLCAAIVLDPDSQTGRWIAEDSNGIPMTDRHKRSETSKETSTKRR